MGTRNALKDERLRGKLSFFETLILNPFFSPPGLADGIGTSTEITTPMQLALFRPPQWKS